MTNISVEYIEDADSEKNCWAALCDNPLFCALYDGTKTQVFEHLHLIDELVCYENANGDAIYTTVLIEYILHGEFDLDPEIVRLLAQSLNHTDMINHVKTCEFSAMDFILMCGQYEVALIMLDHGAKSNKTTLLTLLQHVSNPAPLFEFCNMCKIDFNELLYTPVDETHTLAQPLIMIAISKKKHQLFNLLLPLHTPTIYCYLIDHVNGVNVAIDVLDYSLQHNNVHAAQCILHKYKDNISNTISLVDIALAPVIEKTRSIDEIRDMLILLYKNKFVLFDTENTPINIQTSVNKIFLQQYTRECAEKIKGQKILIGALNLKLSLAKHSALPGKEFVKLLHEYKGEKMSISEFVENQFE